MTRRTTSKVKHDYPRYSSINDDDVGQQADVQTDVVDDLDNIFAQAALKESVDGLSATADDLLVIAQLWHSFQRRFPLRSPISPIL